MLKYTPKLKRQGTLPASALEGTKMTAAVPGFTTPDLPASATLDQVIERVNANSRSILALQQDAFLMRMQLDRLRANIQVDSAGNVQIVSDGKLLLSAAESVSIEAMFVSVETLTSTLEMTSQGMFVAGGGTFSVDMPALRFNTGMCYIYTPTLNCPGRIKADVFQAATSMISPSYTPGAGNIW